MYSYEWLRVQARRIGIDLTDRQLDQFKSYERFLAAEKDKFNLIAADQGRLIPDHFLDSLSAVLCGRLFETNNMVDIGSGAGFPGIPLKIVFPDIKLTLIESRIKRAQFLRQLILEIGLDDAHVLTSRAEDIGRDPHFREKNDVVVVRAVAKLTVLVEYALPLLAVGGLLIALKGPKALAEIQAAKTAAYRLGGEVSEVIKVDIVPDRERNLVVIEKKAATPAEFPRRAGIPSKRPL